MLTANKNGESSSHSTSMCEIICEQRAEISVPLTCIASSFDESCDENMNKFIYTLPKKLFADEDQKLLKNKKFRLIRATIKDHFVRM